MEHVTCISLDDKIFRTVLGTYIRELNQERLKYLQNIKLFNGWDRVSLVGLLTHIFVRSPKKEEYIYRTGEVDKNIYIVVKGELELVAEYDPVKEKMENRKIEQKTNEEKFEEKYILKEGGVKKELSILKITEGNYCGDEDGFSGDIKSYSVRIKSSVTKLFLIPKDVRIQKIILFRKLLRIQKPKGY